jgi:hypothetical protein
LTPRATFREDDDSERGRVPGPLRARPVMTVLAVSPMRPPSLRSSFMPLAVSALCAAAGLGLASPARAAVDDMSAPPSPIEAAPAVAAKPAAAQRARATPETQAKTKAGATVAEATRHLASDALAAERAAVAMLRDHVVSPVMDSSWRLSVSAPRVTRATSLVARTQVTTDLSSPATPEAADSPLGARWRVVHGDASLHVPAASWMPDMQSVDAHLVAQRPVMNLSGEWALPGDFSLGVMPGVAFDMTPQGKRLATGTFALTLGRTWSPQWRTFVDMARDRMGAVQIAGVSTTVDAGMSYLATSGVQIDFALTHGLDDGAAPFQAGVGVSSRF